MSASYNKNNSRYPHTFACDWVRDCVGLDSRADASRWIKRLAAWKRVDPEYVYRELADQFIQHHSKIEELERSKAMTAEHWKHMDKLMSNTEKVD